MFLLLNLSSRLEKIFAVTGLPQADLQPQIAYTKV